MGTDDISLLRYSESCAAVAADYIERATRFNVKDLRVLDARPTVHQFLITVRHQLEVVSDVQDHHGVQQPGQGDFGSADWQWYQEQVTAQAQSEFTRPETMDALVSAVKSKAYGTIANRTCIRTHPRRLFHTFKCSGCHGSGKVTCDGCSGAGKVKCGGCHGSGRVSCSTCYGSGNISQTVQVRDYNGYTRTETQHRPCHVCSGGRVSCFSCGGAGRKRCGTCDGSGQLTCAGCSGHGCLTKITTTHTYTKPGFSGRYPPGTPDYVHSALNKVGFAILGAHGKIALQTVNVVREKSAVEFVYECAMPFCELEVEVRGLKSNWILFGTTPQIFDAGGALEALLQSDFKQLAAVAGGGARWLPWFHRSAEKAVAPFMESELNQQIIDASAQGLKARAIVERVNRAVSEAYVQESLLNLEKTVKAVANWSRLKWLLTFTVLSIPFAIAALAYFERADRQTLFAPATQVFINVPNASGFLWGMGLMTVPFTLVGWFIARWASARWLKKAGGKRMFVWAERNGLLMGKWTAITIVVTATTAASAFFNRWPVWLDSDGKAYGALALFQPPQTIELVAPAMKVATKKRPKNKRATASRHNPAPASNQPEPQLEPQRPTVEAAPGSDWRPVNEQ
jgi:hypothetical protein